MKKILYACDWCNYIKLYEKYIIKLYEKYPSIKTKPIINLNKADYIMLCNKMGGNTGLKLKPNDWKKIILYQWEPLPIRGKWKPWVDQNIKNKIFKVFGITNNRTVVQPHFDIKTNDFMELMKTENKFNKLCSVNSLKYIYKGHKLRVDFMKYLHQQKYDYDLYGQPQLKMFYQYKGKINNKFKILHKYKYYLGIENLNEKNYFTEKIWDAIINECLVFYWGCGNLEKFLPPESFIRLPLDNFNKSLNIIKKSIENNEWEKRLPHIRKAKELCLNKLDLIRTVESLL